MQILMFLRKASSHYGSKLLTSNKRHEKREVRSSKAFPGDHGAGIDNSIKFAAPIISIGLMFAFPIPELFAQDRTQPPCTLQAGPTRAVTRVLDSETLLLDDGREVRLVGALAPRSPNHRADTRPWPPERAAIAALDDLVRGQSVKLAFSGRRSDRYGRLLAHVFLKRGGKRVWVQGELLSSGHARAYGLPGSLACMPELLAREGIARVANAGLWSNAAYAMRPAKRTRALMQLRNTYQIVEGRVVSVVATKGRTYINFDRDWRSDFTAGISAKLLRAKPDWAKALAALEGKEVQVRGWIEYRNGPFIDILDPGQITAIEKERRRPPEKPGAPRISSDRRDITPDPKQKRPAQKTPGAVDL
jgi:endonuclease YncB( thermonuclease family)